MPNYDSALFPRLGRWTRATLIALGVAALAPAAPTLAQNAAIGQESPLASDLVVHLVNRDANGKEVLTPTENAAPGEVMQYTITTTNNGEEPLNGIVVSGPVPINTDYVAGTAGGDRVAATKVSIDKGATFEPEPVKRKRRNAKGELVEVIVPPEEYTDIQWSVSGALKPKEKVVHRYRVRVE